MTQMMDRTTPITPNSQPLFLGQNSTKRLLEVYVKRSLSLNDKAADGGKQRLKSRKWVTVDGCVQQVRRASSDSSALRLSMMKDHVKVTGAETPKQTSASLSPDPPSSTGQQSAKVKPAKRSKGFVLGRFLSFFTRKTNEGKGESDVVLKTYAGSSEAQSNGSTAEVGYNAGAGVPETRSEDYPQASRTMQKKHPLKRFSFRNQDQSAPPNSSPSPSPSAADVVRLPGVVGVELMDSYFEKVSEELERIVKEVTVNPNEDVSNALASPMTLGNPESVDDNNTVERIISLLKEQGDVIDAKIRRNSSLRSFFQSLTYSSFQQLADCYLAQIPSSTASQVSPAPPELLKLAFTLDFTAKLAGLSSQTLGRIMGFGNRYLQDRFTQICAATRRISEDNEEHSVMDPD